MSTARACSLISGDGSEVSPTTILRRRLGLWRITTIPLGYAGCHADRHQRQCCKTGTDREDAAVSERCKRAEADDGARHDGAQASGVDEEAGGSPGRGMMCWKSVRPAPATTAKNQASKTCRPMRSTGPGTNTMAA